MKIKKLEDINFEETRLKAEYYDNFLNGNILAAKKIINRNPMLKFKVLSEENLNVLINSIMELENNFKTNVTNVFDDLITKYQININELIYIEEYSSYIEYKINNFVLYEHEIYFCIKNTEQGILPTNETYWVKLGLRGDISPINTGLNYKGNWENWIVYDINDMIVYNNKIYVARKKNSSINPENNDEVWFLATEVDQKGIIVSKIEPPNMRVGNIWMKIVE